MPVRHGCGVKPQPRRQFGKAELRVLFAQLRPQIVWRGKIIARQHHRPLWQRRHRLHQQRRGRPRTGRARQNNRVLFRSIRPALNQRFYRRALAGLGTAKALIRQRLLVLVQDVEKAQIALPMPRKPLWVDHGQGLEPHRCARHLVLQGGQRLRQPEHRGFGGKVGSGFKIGPYQIGQCQMAQKPALSRGQTGGGPQIADHLDIGQKAGRPVGKQRFQPPLRAAGVDQHRNPRPVFGGGFGHAGAQPVNKALRKIAAYRQGKNARRGVGGKQHKRPRVRSGQLWRGLQGYARESRVGFHPTTTSIPERLVFAQRRTRLRHRDLERGSIPHHLYDRAGRAGLFGRGIAAFGPFRPVGKG